MKRILTLFFLSSFLFGCAPSPAPPILPHTYTPSSSPILNPERGFFTPYELPSPAGFSAVRAVGNTLAHVNFRLDDWRDTDIPQDVLDGLTQNFADMRAEGVKVILRFAYNQGPYPDTEPDASKAQILRHIAQLTPLLQANADVIAWMEAGFIGAWGEWHTSTNGLDNLTDKRDILTALLAAIPNRFVQVRYPANIIDMYPNPADAATAFVAHHNDCFLSSATDVGTYERDGENTLVRDQAYLTELTRFTPMSGETCAPNPPRSDCASALQEMALLHVTALNQAYHKGILRSWEKDGCLAEIAERMGYHLTLQSADFNEQARPGGLLNLTVTLQNTGFASIINERPLYLVLLPSPTQSGGRGAGGEGRYEVQVPIDPRRWEPGTTTFTATFRLPSNAPAGDYTLALFLPDPAPLLRDDPRYAIQFANANTWDETTGLNQLGTLSISPTAGGDTSPTDTLLVINSATVP